MIPIMSQFINRIFKDRIKKIVIIQFILLIPLLIMAVYSFPTNSINYLYNGLFQIIFALINILNSVEQFILKKKGLSISFFILGILFVYLSIKSYNLYLLSK
ncbi:hypothetical protein AC625_00875 [Peribacillus loiseleuriae]|uniref:Uncharacterized protein n=1 Tax=Peribacillus loiseleuriae TaxID=1679170 RepID=A0A0K9GPR8_9BACI|nr:hypothetical protein AC625_00875 [Peribacillus loiseleuriae]